MKIGLNLLYLIPGMVGGTETYAVSLVNALALLDHKNEYLIFVNEEAAHLPLPNAPNVHRVVCRFRAQYRPVRYAWEQVILPLQLLRHRVDIIHSLGYVGPLICPCPSVVTIHDLNYIALKGTIPEGKRRILQFFSIQAARRSNHVITDSEFSKNQIQHLLDLSQTKITVTHLGPRIGLDNTNNARELVRSQYHLPDHYVVAFGGLSAHKNIPRLIEAFIQACKDLSYSLVVIGHLPPQVDLVAEEARAGSSQRVITLGYVPNAHVAPILGLADLFVLPSLYEGFGLPILEAQQANVASACSTAASLPEVAGDGALFFDPLSVDEMASAIYRCLSDVNLRAKLQRLGQENVKRFSWTKTAQETLAVYQQLHPQCTS